VIRVTGETIALSPPLIVSEKEIGEMFEKLGKVLRTVT
jgi:beta-alanine--pyruvate transaminase